MFKLIIVSVARESIFFLVHFLLCIVFSNFSMLNSVKQLDLQHHSFLNDFIQGKDKTAEERRIAICIFDDVAEQCREAALK